MLYTIHRSRFIEPGVLLLPYLRHAHCPQAHFALWALYKSPLLIGTDIRKATDSTKAILQVSDRYTENP